MKHLLCALFFCFLFNNLKAQNCNCGDNFKFMVERIKKNYVGYNDKVNKKTQKQFEHLTDSLQKIADHTKINKCLSVCKQWLNFFKDGHMAVTLNENNPKDAIRDFFSKEEKTNWTEDKFKAYLIKFKDQKDNVEGIWSRIDNMYKYGVVRDSLNQDEFIGFIVKADGAIWIPQQVKFRVKKTNGVYKFTSFFARDHSDYPARVSIDKDTMDLKEIGKLYKNDLPVKQQYNLTNPRFKKLDDKTCLLTIPSFDFRLRNESDSLMIKNASVLKNTDHLIIDLRNNRGGAVGSFEQILPYLYTNPILSEAAQVLATDDNIKDGYEEIPAELPQDVQDTFRKDLAKLKEHRGELYLLYPADTIKYTVSKKPSRVSVLINEGSASSSELFTLQAKQSTKTKIYGTNSAGSINYVERVESQMPCIFFTLIYPPARLLRANSDGADPGIKPDVEIPDTVTDWIDFVKKYRN